MNLLYRPVTYVTILTLFVFALSANSLARDVYPYGVEGPQAIIGGIYPGTEGDNCCWVAPQAAFRIAAPSGADTVLLDLYEPPFALTAAATQGLSIRVDGGPAQIDCCFGAGEREAVFHLPRSHGSRVEISIRARTWFVPKDIGMNQDPRRLTVLLRGISLENSATGERYESGSITAASPRLTLAFLIVGAMLIFAAATYRPVLGLAALIITDPFSLTYAVHGTTIGLPKVALLAVAAALVPRARALLRERPPKRAMILAAAQMLFVATMLIAALHAQFHAAAARETLKQIQFLVTLAVAYAAYRLERNEQIVRVSIAGITLLTIVLAAIAAAQGASESEVLHGHTFARLAGPLEGPNQFAGFLGVVVPVMFAFAVLRGASLLEYFSIAAGSIACLLTFSRGGILALVAACAAIVAVHYAPRLRRVTAIVGGGLFATLLALTFAVFTGELHGRAVALFGTGTGGGLGTRTELWRGAYALWRAHPLFGVGPGNYEILIGRLFPGVRTHANSMYFQALVEQGLGGLIAQLVLAISAVAVYARRLEQPLVLGAMGAGVAMAFHQIVDCIAIYPKAGVLWWVVLALGAAG